MVGMAMALMVVLVELKLESVFVRERNMFACEQSAGVALDLEKCEGYH